MTKKRYAVMIVVIILLAACRAPSEEPGGELRSIRLPMGYIPNVQYAPFYAAVDQGYFADEGIEIEFDYSYETDGVALVGAGELEFAVVSGEQVLLARSNEIPVVYVMSWYQDYPIAVVSDAALGIEEPADLAGHTMGLPGLFGANYIGLKALLNYAEIAEKDVILESIGFNQVEAFTTGQSNIIVGYKANEPVQLNSLGFETNVMFTADYIELASNGLIANETMLVDDPDLIRRMNRAVLKGIQYVLDNQDEAYEICKKFVENLAEADEAVQKEVLRVSSEFYGAEASGYSNPASWKNMRDVLANMELVSGDLNYEDAFTNEFLP